ESSRKSGGIPHRPEVSQDQPGSGDGRGLYDPGSACQSCGGMRKMFVRWLGMDLFPGGTYEMIGDQRFQLPQFPGADKPNPSLAVGLSGIPADE
ncbi:MAG: hypothetical protein ABSA10_10510, partial [Anaerolineales bacterium]